MNTSAFFMMIGTISLVTGLTVYFFKRIFESPVNSEVPILLADSQQESTS